jgi:hypothetical protein
MERADYTSRTRTAKLHEARASLQPKTGQSDGGA